MKTLSVTKVARNFSAVMDDLERDQEEVVLMRNQKPIARLVPESPHRRAEASPVRVGSLVQTYGTSESPLTSCCMRRRVMALRRGGFRAALEAGADEYVMKPFDRETLHIKLQLVGVA